MCSGPGCRWPLASSRSALHLLSGIHAKGLSTCTILRELMCAGGEIRATGAIQCIDIRPDAVIAFPQTIPALHHMTLLELELHSEVTGRFSLRLYSTLTALEQLCVNCMVNDPEGKVVLCDSLTCLRKLQFLQVTLQSTARLVSSMRWHMMKELHVIVLSANESQFDLNILGLTQLDCLEELILGYGRPFDRDTAGYLGSLMYHMALLRPSVSCSMPCHEGHANPKDQLSNVKVLL